MISCKDQALIDKVVADITYAYKEVWMQRGKIRPYLGMMFDFTKKGKVIVVMDGYVTDLRQSSIRETESSCIARLLKSSTLAST